MNDTTVIATDQAEDVRAYVGAVRAWLGDLPPEEVEDLTAGMEADLAERAAESGDTLGALLGEPEAYAAELRSAAGLPPRWAPVAAVAPRPGALRSLGASVRATGDDAVRRLPWLRDLRPTWWLARGAVAGWVVQSMIGSSSWFLPLVGAAVSFWIGRRTASGRMPSWSRGLLVAGNALAILLLLPATASLLSSGGDDGEIGAAFVPDGLSLNGEPVQNLYAYDAAGHRLDDVRLFDQYGQPLQVRAGVVPGPVGPGGREVAPWPTDERALGVFPLRPAPGSDPWVVEDGAWVPPVLIAPLDGSAATPTPTASPSAGPGASPAPSPSASPVPSASSTP